MKEERKAKLNEIRQRLTRLTDQEKQCNGHQPSIVGGFKQWRRAGRTVMKGQHGYSILFPTGTKDSETGDIEDVCKFCAGTVFDIAQTEELEAPAPDQAPIETPATEPEPEPALAMAGQLL